MILTTTIRLCAPMKLLPRRLRHRRVRCLRSRSYRRLHGRPHNLHLLRLQGSRLLLIPLHDILLLLLTIFGFFLKAAKNDALAFVIAPNASVHALGLRNLSHYADPPPAPVLISPPPLPSPLMSLAPVPSSSSSSSSEISDDSDDNDSPLCPDEASSPSSSAS